MLIISSVSNQFGPRLIPNFINSKITQITLGIYLATFVFCLFAIYLPANEGVRSIHTVYAFILTLFCLVYLVIFLNHVIQSIQIDGILSRVINETKHAILHTFTNEEKNLRKNDFQHEGAETIVISSLKDGYTQAIDYLYIKKIAKSASLKICIPVKPGDYIYRDSELLSIYLQPNQTIKPGVKLLLRSCIQILDIRIFHHDLEYGFDQISEIAVRALSPGINDPYTARECICLLGSLFLFLDNQNNIELDTLVLGEDAQIHFKTYSYSGVVDAGLSPIRQAVGVDMTIVLAVFDMLIKLIPHIKHLSLALALENQAYNLKKMTEKTPLSPHDQTALNERIDSVKRLLTTKKNKYKQM